MGHALALLFMHMPMERRRLRSTNPCMWACGWVMLGSRPDVVQRPDNATHDRHDHHPDGMLIRMRQRRIISTSTGRGCTT